MSRERMRPENSPSQQRACYVRAMKRSRHTKPPIGWNKSAKPSRDDGPIVFSWTLIGNTRVEGLAL